MKLGILIAMGQLWSVYAFSACKSWQGPSEIGVLNSELVNEASGLAVSRIHPDRSYHINDSGDGAFIYMSRWNGTSTKRISIDLQERPRDVEDLGYGRCGDDHCLVIADIGDNGRRRSSVQLTFIKEQKIYKGPVAVYQRVLANYPDGPRDAEALVLHPNGDVFIITKEVDYNAGKVFPAKIYRISRDKMSLRFQARQAGYPKASSPIVMEYVADIDLPFLFQKQSPWGSNGDSCRCFDFGEKVAIAHVRNSD